MFEALAVLIVLGGGLAVAVYAWRNLQIGERARSRVASVADAAGPAEQAPAVMARPFLRRHRGVPWIFGAVAAAVAYFLLGWTIPFAVAVAVLVGFLGGQGEELWSARKAARIEIQLADAIDLMVGALGAGAGLANSLEHVLSEAKPPLQVQLEELVGRIRFGDDPRTVFRELVERVPLETFQLFSTALAVHWETGGNLAPILANVGRTIRDRIEIARRIESNIAQSQLSTVAVLGVTYFLALLSWKSNPGQTALFLSSALGQWLVSATILLQGIGIVWMSAVSRLKY
jgi:Flp pilus assembly protein TadB